MKKQVLHAGMLVLASAIVASPPSSASACGCFSPPLPTPTTGDAFAVNQEAEQIIFEVPGDGTVVAHVLIRYQGKPSRFAWIVPVPTAPALSLSETHAFTLLGTLDPVRAAEDYATLDLLSDGRVEVVTGRGVLQNTYTAFGLEVEKSREIS